MKKMNFKSSFLSQFVLLVVLFLAGISSANAQTSFKQNEDAVLILRSEVNAIKSTILQNSSPASATYKYNESKVNLYKVIAQAINEGATTEAAIDAVFKSGVMSQDVINSGNGFTDRTDVTQVRKDVELALKN